MMIPRRALLSVSDKAGLDALATALVGLGCELIASGGTARHVEALGLPVTRVEALTGLPELLGGRVKTLHPAIHGGVLSDRSAAHRADLERHGLRPIDLVVVNLYPFEAAPEIENIDVGGVALLRAAAKNHAHVVTVCDPEDYPRLLSQLEAGGVPPEARRRLAAKAFGRAAAYDQAIAGWLDEDRLDLRYGENPHQEARWLPTPGRGAPFELLGGKALSYNNLLDLDAAWAAAQEFADPGVVIVKHLSPCGVATAERAAAAFPRALASDPVSAFGGVIAVNCPVDLDLCEAIGGLFVEALVAPGFSEAALGWLRRKKRRCRVVRITGLIEGDVQARSCLGGRLEQTADERGADTAGWRCVTQRQPTPEERASLAFAWIVAKHARSNAIVLARGSATVGIGGGQPNRLDSVRIAARRAGERAQGAALASDAFFPFADGVEAAAAAGVTAVVQPGGSIRDAEVIAAADRLGLAMMFTGERHFRH